jgi:hypothetical protein
MCPDLDHFRRIHLCMRKLRWARHSRCSSCLVRRPRAGRLNCSGVSASFGRFAVIPPPAGLRPGGPGERAPWASDWRATLASSRKLGPASARAPPPLGSRLLHRSSRQAGPANLLAYRDMPSTCKELRDHSRYARLVRAKWTCGDSRRRIHLVAHSSRCSDAQGSRVWFAMARHASAAHGVR